MALFAVIKTNLEDWRRKRSQRKVSKHLNLPICSNYNLLIPEEITSDIKEKQIYSVINSIKNIININGKVLIFEHTSNKPKFGKGWQKLPNKKYQFYFEQFGLKKNRDILISYPLYNLLGRYIFHFLVFIFFRGDFLKANSNRLFQHLSHKFILLTRNIDRFFKSKAGNSLIVFTK